MLLYLLVCTYITFIRAPSYQNFHYFRVSFGNYLTTLSCLPLLFIIHRHSLSLIVHVYSTATGFMALLSTTLWLNHAHHNLLIILLCLSTHLSSLPVRSSTHCHARPQPYITSTQTYIHLNKLPPAYITFTARLRNSPTHLSLLSATLLLCGDIQPSPGPAHPANLLICTLNTRSMLTPEHVTALNDLTDNHKPDIIALTWIRSSTTSSHKHGYVAPQHLPS